MGGTSVLFTSVAFGIIMSVSKFIESMQEEQPVPEKELIPITKKDSVIKKYEEDESDH